MASAATALAKAADALHNALLGASSRKIKRVSRLPLLRWISQPDATKMLRSAAVAALERKNVVAAAATDVSKNTTNTNITAAITGAVGLGSTRCGIEAERMLTSNTAIMNSESIIKMEDDARNLLNNGPGIPPRQVMNSIGFDGVSLYEQNQPKSISSDLGPIIERPVRSILVHVPQFSKLIADGNTVEESLPGVVLSSTLTPALSYSKAIVALQNDTIVMPSLADVLRDSGDDNSLTVVQLNGFDRDLDTTRKILHALECISLPPVLPILSGQSDAAVEELGSLVSHHVALEPLPTPVLVGRLCEALDLNFLLLPRSFRRFLLDCGGIPRFYDAIGKTLLGSPKWLSTLRDLPVHFPRHEFEEAVFISLSQVYSLQMLQDALRRGDGEDNSDEIGARRLSMLILLASRSPAATVKEPPPEHLLQLPLNRLMQSGAVPFRKDGIPHIPLALVRLWNREGTNRAIKATMSCDFTSIRKMKRNRRGKVSPSQALRDARRERLYLKFPRTAPFPLFPRQILSPFSTLGLESFSDLACFGQLLRHNTICEAGLATTTLGILLGPRGTVLARPETMSRPVTLTSCSVVKSQRAVPFGSNVDSPKLNVQLDSVPHNLPGLPESFVERSLLIGGRMVRNWFGYPAFDAIMVHPASFVNGVDHPSLVHVFRFLPGDDPLSMYDILSEFEKCVGNDKFELVVPEKMRQNYFTTSDGQHRTSDNEFSNSICNNDVLRLQRLAVLDGFFRDDRQLLFTLITSRKLYGFSEIVSATNSCNEGSPLCLPKGISVVSGEQLPYWLPSFAAYRARFSSEDTEVALAERNLQYQRRKMANRSVEPLYIDEDPSKIFTATNNLKDRCDDGDRGPDISSDCSKSKSIETGDPSVEWPREVTDEILGPKAKTFRKYNYRNQNLYSRHNNLNDKQRRLRMEATF